MNEKVEQIKEKMGWTDRELAYLLGYKSVRSFRSARGREGKLEILVRLYEAIRDKVQNNL